jgi:FkbM family methyltransferase
VSALSIVRWLRHGPLSFLGPLWLQLGRLYRAAARHVPGLSVPQKIGPYGPFRLVPEFTFSNFESWGGLHNRGFRACVEACRGKTCVLDVGAHIGLVTLPAASVLAKDGRLHAFEPAAANARILRRHLQLNGVQTVEVIQALVGERDGAQVAFFESAGPHGQNSIVLKGGDKLSSEWGGYARTERPQVSLDNHCERLNLAPEIIKVDVEGGELGVLRGARAVLARYSPLLFLSVHPREIQLTGESLEALRALLDEVGYEARDLDGHPVAEFRLDEYVVTPRHVTSRFA